MSQQQIPTNGGVSQVQTTTVTPRVNALSKQYITQNNLESRPTEWVPGGRPIYRRLPATAETYQIDFFNVVTVPNTAVSVAREEIGYVYIPWGEGIFGPVSLEVVASDSLKDVVVKGGNVVWQYGTTPVIPSVFNLEELDIGSGTYYVAYELIYDDSPFEALYEVSDYALTGEPLEVTGSTDILSGWRNPAINAFLNTDTLFWKNYDSFFPTYLQPTSAFIQWQSQLPSAYSQILLRCPPNTAITGEVRLYYYDTASASYDLVCSAPVEKDLTSQFFRLNAFDPTFQTTWKVEFDDLKVAVQSIEVTGTITKLRRPVAPRPRASLVMYPENQVPRTVINDNGVEVTPTYCELAFVSIGDGFVIEDIRDIRNIIHRDYVPVSDWLTKPFDETLIDLYEQVKGFDRFWLAPTSLLKQEYAALEKYGIVITNSTTLGQ
jgi:hypothetical protein